MTSPDLNLLVALDVLLTEGSVARAASRLRLSPSAMSRTLARLREATGDPLLVRAGRGLVATPRAEELRQQAGRVVQDAEALLRPARLLDLASLDRIFTLRTNEGFVEEFGPRLVARIQAEAPGVRLRFAPKSDKDVDVAARCGRSTSKSALPAKPDPEVRIQALFRDRFIGAVRAGHRLERGRGDAGALRGRPAHQRFAARPREGADRRGLAQLGLQRTVVCMVSGFSAALAMARASDLIASVPERHTEGARAGMCQLSAAGRHRRRSPSPCSGIRASTADPAQRWLRDCVREVCAAAR